ncbi:MAG TPA: tRNA (guanosine(37)-N1)-methyltransferase TrmD [Mycobacteriales bacterium]|nr:tRNA (guanosine(37)-N1)-methyltransferase TrmD [Mycobacteriales bacterium]
MRIDVVTIFPEYFAPLKQALLGRAIERGLITAQVHDLRQWTADVHRTVDDPPYGGGPGMVMKPEPWGQALDAVAPDGATLIVPTPAGYSFTQRHAEDFATRPHLVFACGRYEGIDQRVADSARSRLRVEEVSIGDYVLAGGEVATLTMIEAVTRLLPGVVGNTASVEEDSFAGGLLEGPVYTRPEVWRGHAVPEVLRSGNHAVIKRWERDESLRRTAARRPDLLASARLDATDRQVLIEAGFHLPDRDMAP